MNPLKMQIFSEAEYNSFNENDVYMNGPATNDIYMSGTPQTMEDGGNSTPFIIILTNTSGAAISNVDFLNAVSSFGATNDGVTTGVTPTVGYSNRTYKEFLGLLLSTDLIVGSFYIEATTNAQATATLLFRTDNQRGKALEDTVVPEIHHFQNQTGLAYVEQKVTINKYTKCTLSSIAASATYKLKLFPYKRSATFGTEVVYGKPTFIQTTAGINPALGR